VPDPRAFGCVPTDETGAVLEFLEKTENPPTDQINAGCYVFRRTVIDSIPEGRPVSVERETFPGLLASGARVSGHVDNAYWRDMGTPLDLVHGSADLVRGIAPSAALPGPTGERLLLDGAVVHPDARVFGGSTVGRGVTVGAGARVDGAMLYDGAVIGENAVVEHSVVGAGARVQAGAVVIDTVVGDRAVIGERCELRGGARVWPASQRIATMIPATTTSSVCAEPSRLSIRAEMRWVSASTMWRAVDAIMLSAGNCANMASAASRRLSSPSPMNARPSSSDISR